MQSERQEAVKALQQELFASDAGLAVALTMPTQSWPMASQFFNECADADRLSRH